VTGVGHADRPTEIAASILDADLGRLADEIARAEAAGADRIHLDVMDAHFVPNLTFGPKTIAAVRAASRLPFDAHLMTSEPGRFLQGYLEAGCDSVTFHVEIEEPIRPTLDAIHAAGRLAGLALKPATPLSALDPFRGDLDIVMVMTVEPGFGGQAFLPGPAEKIAAAARWLRAGGRVHVDGGVKAANAALLGRLGIDVLVVGTALWRAPDMAAEIRTIRDLATAAGTAPSPGATYAAVHPRPTVDR
jgi:ribulose-phosphate 3-epimerase